MTRGRASDHETSNCCRLAGFPMQFIFFNLLQIFLFHRQFCQFCQLLAHSTSMAASGLPNQVRFDPCIFCLGSNYSQRITIMTPFIHCQMIHIQVLIQVCNEDSLVHFTLLQLHNPAKKGARVVFNDSINESGMWCPPTLFPSIKFQQT